MALCNILDVKTALGISGATSDVVLDLCVTAADRGIKDYCNQEFETRQYTHYFSGHGLKELVLREAPVQSVTAVYMDATGYFGQGTNSPFAASTQLAAGTDYALRLDDSLNGWSTSGILDRLGSANNQGYYFQPWGGTLALGGRSTSWNKGQGNIKVIYTAGYTVDTIPSTLKSCCIFFASHIYKTFPNAGHMASSESLGGYSYSLMGESGGSPELGSMRQMLTKYRRRAL